MKKLVTILATAAFFNINAQIITTVAGDSTGGYNGDGGLAINYQLNNPYGVATDQYRNLYIADMNNNLVRKVTLSTGVISTIAGSGTYGFSGDNGAATAARLADPFGVAVDASGNVYIADRSNNRIRKVTPSGTISTFAGNGTLGYSGDGADATAAELSGPIGLALDASGNLYIADYYSNTIRMVNQSGTISTVAGNNTQGYSGDGGAAISAQLSHPTGVSVDALGNLYIADYSNNCVRMVTSGGTISTVAGNNTQGFSGDGGQANSAQLSHPWGVATSAGNLFISDYANNRIRKVNTSNIISTVAGNGTQAYAGDCGSPTSAQLAYPAGLATDNYGNLYIADNSNNRVRKLFFNATATHVTAHSSVTSTRLCQGSSITFTGGGASTYTWNNGAVDGTPYIVPSITSTTVTANYFTVIGTDTIGCTNSVTIKDSIAPRPTVTVASTIICAGQYTTLTAILTPTNVASTYVWSNGVVNGVPFMPSATSHYIVTGTDVYGCSNVATATVTVVSTSNPLPVISVSSSSISSCGSSGTLTASGATTYTWSNGQTGANALVTPTITTTYTVTGSLQGCIATNTVTQFVNALYITSTTDTVCNGSKDTLRGNPTIALTSNQSIKYYWGVSTAAATYSVVTPSTTTTYTVKGTITTITATDTTSCSTGATFTQIVRSLNLVSTVDSLCNGSSTSLMASGANSYTWNPGSQNGASVIITPTVTTTYSVIGTAQTCTVTGTLKQVVKQPLQMTVSSNVDTLCVGDMATLTASGTNSYIWSTTQTSASINVSPVNTTNYLVTGTKNGCSVTDTLTQPVNISCFAGIKQLANATQVTLYPNPVLNGSFTVLLNENTVNTTICVINAIGQKVYETKSAGLETKIELPNYQAGIYFVQIKNSNGTSVKKIIVD